MKECSKCRLTKSEEEFPWRKKDVKRASVCKECQRLLAKQHYNNNTQYYKDKTNKNRKSYNDRGKKFIIDYLLQHPCIDCGEKDIEVLHFDHVDALNNHKALRVTSLVGRSIKRIKEEIEKCEVRCANCHTRKTRREAGTLRMPQ